MMNERSREFLTKLKSLLAEYDARIAWGCGEHSDLYGLYQEHMYIDFGDHEVTVCDGNGIGQEDISAKRQEK